MKKRLVSIAAVAVLGAGAAMTEAPAANAVYGPLPPTSVIVVPQTVNTLIAQQGSVGPKRAAKLIRKLRQAQRAGLISKKRMKRLIRRVQNHTR